MFLSADRLDNLLATVFDRIRKRGVVVNPTKGPTKELFGVLLHLKEPRARTSRTEMKGSIYSGLGELLWYLSGSKALDFISYYASQYEAETDDKVTVHGAYGPRLFSMRGVNQIQNVLELLRTRPFSPRRYSTVRRGGSCRALPERSVHQYPPIRCSGRPSPHADEHAIK